MPPGEEVTIEAGASEQTLSAEEVAIPETHEDIIATEETAIPQEPSDNAERSKLGRKVKDLGMANAEMRDIINELRNPRKPDEDSLVDLDGLSMSDDDEEISFRKGDLRKEILNIVKAAIPKAVPRELEKVSKKETEYNRNVTKELGVLGSDLDDEIFNEISDIIVKSFKSYTGNPEIDARINYYKAKAEILEKKVKSPKKTNPLDKNKGKDLKNLGGAGGETSPAKGKTALSAEMKALQKKYNLSDEAAIRAANQIGK